MGFQHVQAGRFYANGSEGGGLLFEGLPYKGQAVTTLPNGAVTDSATSGTALATGYQHPANGTISTDTSGNPVQTILEKARSFGWRTGIITTDDIGGATPGSFGAHEPDRGLVAEIRYDYIVDDSNHAASLPNVLFGGGASADYAALATSAGYTVVTGITDLNLLDLLGLAQPRLLGQFAPSVLTLEITRSPDSTEPRLSDMVRRGLELLSMEPAGFFLVVEGALIDKLSHVNNTVALGPEMAQFELAFQEAMTWVESNGGFQNTLVLVTADHETGGLNVPDGQYVLPGVMPELSWSSTGHTAADVPIYASWPPSIAGTQIDNTETFFVMEDWLAGVEGQPPVILDLSVGNIKQTSAIVSWTTREPSTGLVECYLGETHVVSGSDDARITSHQFALAGLEPDTEYEVRVWSVDLAGFLGAGTVSLRTASLDVDAYVQAEPQVTLGSVSGSFTALTAPGDGQVQTITETTSGTGSGLSAVYTLRTSAPANSIADVTLNVGFTWTDRDRGKDNVVVSVYNVVYSRWDTVTMNSGGSFALSPPLAYVDATGNLRVRFADTALIAREKKDILTVDWLQADVVAGPPDIQPPSVPTGFAAAASGAAELTAILAWTANPEPDIAGYLVHRNDWADNVFTDQPGYTDRAMRGGSYNYAIAAVDLSGNVSDWTESIAIDLFNQTAPSAPMNLQATAGDGEVFLTWDQNTEWDVIGYNVYVEETGGWTQIDDGVVSNSFSHSGLVNGQTYRYRVTAIDSGLESLPSGIEATPSATPKVWIESIAVSLQSAGKNWKATAAVQVLADGVPVAGATVNGDWLFNGQSLASGVTGTCDTTGGVSLTSPPVKASSGTFVFRATAVVLPGYTYEPAGHVVEGSATIGL